MGKGKITPPFDWIGQRDWIKKVSSCRDRNCIVCPYFLPKNIEMECQNPIVVSLRQLLPKEAIKNRKLPKVFIKELVWDKPIKSINLEDWL